MSQIKYIRYFSDLHLEFDVRDKRNLWRPQPLETDNETVLILAGDIWSGKRTVDWLEFFAREFAQILIVMGNHDYWGVETIHTLNDTIEYELRRKGLSDRVMILHRDSPLFNTGEYIFVGATLWTDMDRHAPYTVGAATGYMRPDFTYIYRENKFGEDYLLRQKSWTVDDWLNENTLDFQHISEVVEDVKDSYKVIVITHHGCSKQSVHHRFKGDPGNGYFVSEYDQFIIDNPHIKYWFHGHVHNCFDYVIGETKIKVNPRGYPNESSEFDEIALIELE